MMLTFCRSVGEIDRNLQLKSNNLAEYCTAEIKFNSCYWMRIKYYSSGNLGLLLQECK